MAISQIPLKKLVFEWRYMPALTFYNRMDDVAGEFLDDFPDWQRTPLTVEVRNRKRHRRLFLSHQRSFFDSDGPKDRHAEFDLAKTLAEKTSTRFEISTYRRFGIRQWSIAELDRTFPAMVDLVASRFCERNETLDKVLGNRLKDVAYVVDMEHDDGWQFKLRLGPMEKKQWFETVAYERGAFESDEEGETFEKFRNTIPDQFMYIDIDCFQLDLERANIAQFFSSVRRGTHDIVQGLIDYCRESTS